MYLKNEDQDMEYDKDKVDEMMLALLYLTTHEQRTRAWIWHEGKQESNGGLTF